jgi:hypothetical protein
VASKPTDRDLDRRAENCRRWTHTDASREYTPMHWIFLLAGLAVAALSAGCSGSPQKMGITGPAPQVEPQMAPADATTQSPGLPDPNTGSGAEQRYFHYN